MNLNKCLTVIIEIVQRLVRKRPASKVLNNQR